MTTSFFVPRTHFRGDICDFPPEEARHLVRVLRHTTGDNVRVVDGEGVAYIVQLTEVGKDRSSGRVITRLPGDGESALHITIASALLKQRGRYETFLEKAVELGVSEIVPLITARTEKGAIRLDRAENLLLAAMKQSGRSMLSHLHQPTSLDDLLAARGDADEPDNGIVCHESADGSPELPAVLRRAASRRITILIGPEGGFTEDEIAACKEAGLEVARLGPRRLRAETAAVVAATACMFYDSEIIRNESD